MIVEASMESFAKASKKKPRYYLNSWLHRMKLHCLQPILFCETITQRTIEILVEELLNINNQLNVTYLIELILARHYPNIMEILTDDGKLFDLKTTSLKSIFAIVVMQLRTQDSFRIQSLEENFFGIAEVKLERAYDFIIPFTMGQNYSVRSYAQASVIILYKSVKAQFGARKSDVMARIARSCEVINESMKFKNASRFFEALLRDFRFTLKFDGIMTVETIYDLMPRATRMPFEEIISTHMEGEDEREELQIAEIENESETLTVSDEIVVPVAAEKAPSVVNLQQKYLPFKYQVPGEKIMGTLPSVFKNDNIMKSGMVKILFRSSAHSQTFPAFTAIKIKFNSRRITCRQTYKPRGISKNL